LYRKSGSKQGGKAGLKPFPKRPDASFDNKSNTRHINRVEYFLYHPILGNIEGFVDASLAPCLVRQI
jgi:hypothetical protein